MYSVVQHFASRGSSQRRKSAASHIISLVWLYHSPIFSSREERGILFVQIKTTCLRGA
jgi:hypothetical protein